MIERAAHGDVQARSSFTRSFLPVARAFLKARWLGTALLPDLDDCVQEVFVECLRERGALTRADPSRGDLHGLMYGITRNVAARFEKSWQQRARREAAIGSVLERIQAGEPSQSRVFDREWARSLLRMTADLMGERARHGDPGARLRVELLRLRFHDGLPIRDIARHWEMNADALHRAYARARDEFRDCLRCIVREQVVRTAVELEDEVLRILQVLE